MTMRTLLHASAVAGALFALGGAVATASAATLTFSDTGIAADERTQLPGNFNPGSAAVDAINGFIDPNDTGLDILNEDLVVFEGDTGSKDPTQDGLGVDLQGQDSVKLRFTYFGSEAGFQNLALYTNSGDAVTLFQNKSFGGNPASSIGDFQVISFGTGAGDVALGPNGLIPFVYETLGGGGGVADNAGDITGTLELAYTKTLFTNVFGVENGSTIAFFGDGTGDSDLDDLIVGIGVVPVPLPAPLAMLALGLAGIAGLAFKRRALRSA